MYINDLPNVRSDKSILILSADYTNFIITNHDDNEFKHRDNKVLNKINKRIHSNLLILNFDKIYLLQFITKANEEK
jgi:hypothetical protein